MRAEVVVDLPEALTREFVRRFESDAVRGIEARGRFACALPGGSVAAAFFPTLAEASVDWSRVELFWGDERAVPPVDPDSNYGLAKRLLLDHVAVDPARVHRMAGETGDVVQAAEAYENEMVSVLGAAPSLDLVVVGVGPDGHVCSLFPGHPALREKARSVVAVSDSPKPPPKRITLTLPALARSNWICIVAFGAPKAAILREAIEVEASSLPVALLARSGPRVLYLLDEGAASALTRR